MYHYIYICENPNGTNYFGVHSDKSLDNRYRGSGKIQKRVVKKYGWNEIKKEIIKLFETRETAEKAELHLMPFYKAKEGNINIGSGALGGEKLGMSVSKEHKKKLSEASKNRRKGRIWINNGTISKMCFPDDVPNGFVLGRK
jgi:predicted GIY-YIG superfamily endonuclease